MDGLDGYVFAFKVRGSDSVGDFVEVHRFFRVFENDEDFIADVFRVDSRPFREPPKSVKSRKIFRERSDGGDMGRMFIVEVRIELVERKRRFVFFDDFYDFVDFPLNFLFVAIIGDSETEEVFIVFGDNR